MAINLWQTWDIIKTYTRMYNYLSLRDGGTVWNLYKMNNYIPLNYVIDSNGNVVNSMEGFNESLIRSWIESGLPPVGVEEQPMEIAHIESVRPSPARGSATVRLAMPQAGRASVRVWSSAGRLVRELFSGDMAVGQNEFTWNLADHDGSRVSAGAYFVELVAAGHSSRMKLSILD